MFATRHGSRQWNIAANSADNRCHHGAHVLVEETHATQNQQANPTVCFERVLYGEKSARLGNGSAGGGDGN